MKFHNILDEIPGNKTKVRLLRAFFTYPEKGFTESELERIAGRKIIHKKYFFFLFLIL